MDGDEMRLGRSQTRETRLRLRKNGREMEGGETGTGGRGTGGVWLWPSSVGASVWLLAVGWTLEQRKPPSGAHRVGRHLASWACWHLLGTEDPSSVDCNAWRISLAILIRVRKASAGLVTLQ
jgi:hypothetical protein